MNPPINSALDRAPVSHFTLGLDWDGTANRDPMAWASVAILLRNCGHQVYVVTMRYPSECACDPLLQDFLAQTNAKLITTSREAKAPAMAELGLTVNIWVDDHPRAVLESAQAIWGKATPEGHVVTEHHPEAEMVTLTAPRAQMTSEHTETAPAYPFSDVADKRMSELTPEQQDRATELWVRRQIADNGDYWPRLLYTLLRIIDRLRAEAFTLAAGSCCETNGLNADPGGTPFCLIKQQRDQNGLGWAAEASDLDNVLLLLGLNPEHLRTDGGNLNVPRLIEHLTRPDRTRMEVLVERQRVWLRYGHQKFMLAYGADWPESDESGSPDHDLEWYAQQLRIVLAHGMLPWENHEAATEKAWDDVMDFLERATHWREGGADRHAALQASHVLAVSMVQAGHVPEGCTPADARTLRAANHVLTMLNERLAGPLGDVLKDVAAERQRQNRKWGGPDHDDQHDFPFWVQLIQDYAAWARVMAGMHSWSKARNRLVQVSALAVAAVEVLDRQHPGS